MAEYVYGIVEAGAAPPRGEGIEHAALRVIGGDGAAALVSELSNEHLQLGREAVLAHAKVLGDALAHGTVLPMRFGMVMEGAEDVRRRLLDEHVDSIRSQLERFGGKVEVNVRATYDETMLMREVVRENPEVAQLREQVRAKPEDASYYDRIRLGELVAKALERKRDEDARRIVDALSQVASAVEVSPPAHERVALSASFLVARERLAEFDEVLSAFAEGQGGRLRFKYNGPLPPHSFVELWGGG